MSEIIINTQRIVVDPASSKLQVVGYGAKGDPGPTGPPGPLVPLGSLTDVDLAALEDGAVLYWDVAESKWKVKLFLPITGGTLTGDLTLDNARINLDADGNVYVRREESDEMRLYIRNSSDESLDALRVMADSTETLKLVGTPSRLLLSNNASFGSAEFLELDANDHTVDLFANGTLMMNLEGATKEVKDGSTRQFLRSDNNRGSAILVQADETTGTTTAGTGLFSVTFKESFTSTPVVVMTVRTSTTRTAVLDSSPTHSGFVARYYDVVTGNPAGNATILLNWMAYGPKTNI